MTQHELYQTFVAIYRAGSISGAAKLRHLTQPAVSQQLAALEALVGTSLFQRTPKGAIPTRRGQALYAQVFDALDRLERVSRSLRRSTTINEQSTICLGAPPEYFYTFALERLRGVTFDMHISFGEAKEQLTQLELGTLDAVISTAKPTQRTLQHRVLGQKQFVLVGPPAVALPAPDLSPAELGAWLNQQAWVSYSVDLPITRRFWHQHLGTRFDARQRIVVPDLRAVLRAVELGYGLSILPEFLCQAALREGRIQEVWAVRQLIPSDQWILAFREVDADRPAVIQLGDRLAMPRDEPR